MNWNCDSDEFIFKFEALLKLAESLQPTRRNLLKVTSSFFDPLGILSPVLVQMKLLFQVMCQEKVAWMHHSQSQSDGSGLLGFRI